MKFRKISLFVLLASACLNVAAQNNVSTQKMDWFEDAKLGVFIHWGIYSVDGISIWNTKAYKAIATLQDAAAKQDVITPFVKVNVD